MRASTKLNLRCFSVSGVGLTGFRIEWLEAKGYQFQRSRAEGLGLWAFGFTGLKGLPKQAKNPIPASFSKGRRSLHCKALLGVWEGDRCSRARGMSRFVQLRGLRLKV